MRYKTVIPLILMTLLGLLFTGAAGMLSFKHYQQQELKTLEKRTYDQFYAIHNRIDRSLETLKMLKGFYLASNFVDRNEFKIFSQTILKDYSEIMALEWAPFILDQDRETFQKQVSEETVTNYQILERDKSGAMMPAQKRDFYVPVNYLNPHKGNEAAWGFDLASNKIRLKTILEARDTGEPITTERIDLVQEGHGFLIILPIYENGKEVNTVEQRQKHFKGVVLGAFRINELMKQVLKEQGASQPIIKLIDNFAPAERRLLFDNSKEITKERLFGIEAWLDRLLHPEDNRHHLMVANRPWQLIGTFPPQHHPQLLVFLIAVVVICLVLTGLLISYFWQLIGYTKTVEAAVDLRTDELQNKNVALKRAEERYQLAVEGSTDGLWDWNMLTDEVYYSPRFKELAGYEDHEMLGHLDEWSDKLHPEDKNRVFAAVDTHVRERTPYDVEYRLFCKSGHYRWFRARGRAFFTPEGKAYRMAGSITDITDKKEAQQELEEEKKNLEKVNLELDRFVYTASHDLRAPLRAISSFARFLEEDCKEKLDKDGQEHLDGIQLAVDQMKRLIDDLVSLSRVTRIKNPFTDADMDELFADIAARVQHDLKDKKVTLKIQENIPHVYCDVIKVKEAFLNLISNAVKFSSKNNNQLPLVEVGYEDRGEEHCFFVKDNGIGIDPKYHGEIFNIFRRLHTHEDYEGTGAGLNIVAKIVEEHSGSIWVDSEEGKGATFFVTIPKDLREKEESKE